MKMLPVILLGLLSFVKAAPCTEIRIDLSQTIKPNLRRGAAGANLCWLLASERNQSPEISLKTALHEMGCGALRFPYGALADNYLWHTPPFSDTENGPENATFSGFLTALLARAQTLRNAAISPATAVG